MRTFSLLGLCTIASFGACGDDSTSPTPETGLVVNLPLPPGGFTALCYDVEIRDGAGALVASETEVCTTQDSSAQVLTGCDPSEASADHTVRVDLTGLFLDEGAPFDPSAPGAGDVDEVVNPCEDGCTTDVTCIAEAVTPVTFNVTIMRKTSQGFFNVSIDTPLSELGLGSVCYSLTVKSGEGADVTEPRHICDHNFGSNGVITYVTPCDGSELGKQNTVSIALSGVYAEPTGDPLSDPGLLGDYSYTCDGGCTRTVECLTNADVAVPFEVTLSRL